MTPVLGLGLVAENLGEEFYIVRPEADPAAGAEISITVPGRATWELLSIRAQIVADATVSNRRVNLQLDDGANVFYEVETTAAVTAGQTRPFTWASGIGSTVVGGGSSILLALPWPVVMQPGFRIRTATVNLQAGDNWSAPIMLVRERPRRGEIDEILHRFDRLLNRLEQLPGLWELGV